MSRPLPTRTHRPDFALAAIPALACSIVVQAQTPAAPAEPGMPTIEIIGSPERLPEIAGSATVLDQKELVDSRVFTINEALRKVPGIHVRDEEGFGLRPNIGLRGLNPTRSTKILLLEDGLPLAYAPYGDNASYYHPPIERFERIEVLKGSEQILYGPQTIGGVINYITPAPPEEFGGKLILTGGNREYFNGHLQVGGNNMLLDLSRKQGDGARDNEHSALNDLNFKAVHHFGEGHGITVRANYYTEDSDVSYTGITDAELRNFGYRYNPFENDEFETERWGLSATHEYVFNTAVTLRTNTYVTHFSRDWWRQASTTTDTQCGAAFVTARRAGLAVDPNACNSAQGRLRDYYTYGVEPRLSVDHALFGLEQEFQIGGRAHFERQDRIQKNGTRPAARDGVVVEDNQRDVDAYAFFAQNRISLGQFALTPGVRVERVENERENDLTGGSGEANLTEVIPGIGATYNPLAHTTFFAGIHRGFAPPRTEDLIVTPAGLASATFTDVDAEKSWNLEVGVRSEPRDGARIEATWFRNDFKHQIQVGSIAGGTTPLADGETLYEGLELLSRLDSDQLLGTQDDIYLQMAYTYLPTADQESPVRAVATDTIVAGSAEGNRLPYAPEHMATGTLGYTHTSGFDIRLEAVHVAEQYSDFANTVIAPLGGNGQVGLIKSSLIFNLAANMPVPAWHATFFLTAKNLFDRDYIVDRTRGIRVGMPLLVQGGVEFTF